MQWHGLQIFGLQQIGLKSLGLKNFWVAKAGLKRLGLYSLGLNRYVASTVPYLLTSFHLLSNVIIHLTVNFNYIRRSNTGSASFLLQFCNLFLKKVGGVFFQSKFIMALKSPMSQKGSKA